MIIPFETVSRWLPRNSLIHAGTAHDILKKYYCWVMTNNDTCPLECLKCEARVKFMLSLEHARNPSAVLTYLAKVEAAKAADAKQDFVRIVSDVGNQNVFELIMEEANEAKTKIG